jgi:hypothetical protein
MPPSRGRRVCRSRLSSGKEPPRGSCSGQTMPRRCSASTTGRWPGDHSHAQFGEASRAGWGRLTGAPALMGQSCTPWWLGVTSLRRVPGPPARWPVLSRRLVPIAHPLDGQLAGVFDAASCRRCRLWAVECHLSSAEVPMPCHRAEIDREQSFPEGCPGTAAGSNDIADDDHDAEPDDAIHLAQEV